MEEFAVRQAMPDSSWTQRGLNRLGPSKSLTGREKMRAALKALGFEVR